jgi:hypothetical protein
VPATVGCGAGETLNCGLCGSLIFVIANGPEGESEDYLSTLHLTQTLSVPIYLVSW